ncbi:MAG: hypothetical protein NXI31_26170 [bacterium]|nr:hypothetical protein [bacterium]
MVIRAAPGLANAADFAGACRDNAGNYWTSCKNGNQVLLIRLTPQGVTNGVVYTNFVGTDTVADLAYDAVHDNVWMLVPQRPPAVYHATTGVFIGQGSAIALGAGIAWNGTDRMHVAGSAVAYDTATLATVSGPAVPATDHGLLYSPTSGRFWGTQASGDPGAITMFEHVELPGGATMPPNLRGAIYQGALGGRARGSAIWQEPGNGEWLGVFCVGGDGDSSAIYTARIGVPTTPNCGGPRYRKGPAIVQDQLYVDADQATGLSWLLLSLAPGTFQSPVLAPGCSLGVNLQLASPIGPLIPQNGGVVQPRLAIPLDPILDEIGLWFQLGSLTLANNFVLSETRSAAVKQAGTLPITITERFASSAMRDPQVSSGIWANGAHTGLIGGDGRHGSFDPTVGTEISPGVYEFDTGNTVIPASQAHSGQAETITDGRYFFTDLVIPAGVTVRFVGPVPAVLRVRGQAEIHGTLSLDGEAMESFDARGGTQSPMPFVDGQPGGVPGAGGGFGGRGAFECQGNGPIIVAGEVLTNGAPGEDVQLVAGHAYQAQAIGTGGLGGELNPPSGTAAPNSPRVGFVYRAFFAVGGGGGGFATPGGQGGITSPMPLPLQIASLQANTPPGGGNFFDPLPNPGVSSLAHFLIGGSGGGGGGSHPFGTLFTGNQDTYMAGAGGSGGGGACGLRAGGDVLLAATGRCNSRGGDGAILDGRDPNGSPVIATWGISSPGGGGSGGSFLVQSGADVTVLGDLDTSGGPGSRNVNVTVPNLNLFSSEAGAGSPGYYRVEAAGNLSFQSTNSVPAWSPVNNSGALSDRDAVVGSGSLWYQAGNAVPPSWESYELLVDVNGDGSVDAIYSDSGAPGTQPANQPTDPVRIQFQGARVLNGAALPGTVGQWRDFVGSTLGTGLESDSATGFRFQLIFQRSTFPNCAVKELRVLARS